jgi:hypothetical protein
MIFFGEDSLRKVAREFIAHYHGERNHQGLENRLISPVQRTTTSNEDNDLVECSTPTTGVIPVFGSNGILHKSGSCVSAGKKWGGTAET